MPLTKNTAVKQSTTTNTIHLDSKKAANKVSRVVIRYDVGFNNNLFIRGSGANLSWDKGIAMQNIGPDEWAGETDKPFNSCEFKILINDSQYEQGDNHLLVFGDRLEYTPFF